MKRTLQLLGVIATVFTFVQCANEKIDEVTVVDINLEKRIIEVGGSLDAYKLPNSKENLDQIPQDPKNPLTEVKVKLGNFLFFEPGIGMDASKSEGMATYSCASCHLPSAGFRPGSPQGIADGGMGYGVNGEGRRMNPNYKDTEADVQGTRPLSMLGLAYVTNTLWNGRFGGGGVNVGTEDLWEDYGVAEVNRTGYLGPEAQNIEGLILHRQIINKDLLESISNHPKFNYVKMFDEAFPEFPESYRYSLQTASLAITAYLRTLMPYMAPFQRWLNGDKDALTLQQKEGAMLFYSKARCYLCHNSPAFNSMQFHAIGVKDMWERPDAMGTGPNDNRNLGRGGFTQRPEDMFKFKVPQLYNLNDAPFLFHGASKRTIRDVVEYKNKAISENSNVPNDRLSKLFIPLDLTDDEIDQLVDFLENGLRDPYLDRYRPEFIPSGLCFPNNDTQSIEDLGCQ